MAKKKKKSKLIPIIIAVVVIAILATAGVITALLLKTPSVDGLTNKYNDSGYIAAFIGDNEKAVGALGGTKLSPFEVFAVTYYENVEDAKKAVETGKDALGEKTCFRRGRAVFVGTEAAGKIFKGYMG